MADINRKLLDSIAAMVEVIEEKTRCNQIKIAEVMFLQSASVLIRNGYKPGKLIESLARAYGKDNEGNVNIN